MHIQKNMARCFDEFVERHEFDKKKIAITNFIKRKRVSGKKCRHLYRINKKKNF